jgi:hypothetical protein
MNAAEVAKSTDQPVDLIPYTTNLSIIHRRCASGLRTGGGAAGERRNWKSYAGVFFWNNWGETQVGTDWHQPITSSCGSRSVITIAAPKQGKPCDCE